MSYNKLDPLSFDLQIFIKEQHKYSFFDLSIFLPRGALSTHCAPDEHLAVAPCLWEEDSVARLRLPAHVS